MCKLWNFESDELYLDFKNVVSEIQISTKREFLKVLFPVCDTLIVISPIVMILKILFQKICVINYLERSLLIGKTF